jgi:DNA-binding cell septation regulator SpoVG
MKRHGLSMRTKTKISQKMAQEYEEEEEEEEESSDDDFQGF